jgi:predicted transport protein
MTCHQLGFDSEVGHVEMWTAVLDRLGVAWGKDAAILRRLLKGHCYDLPRGRVTRPGKRFLILHGNDSPCPDWLERVILSFHLDRRSVKSLFDEHERTMAEDRATVSEVLGVEEETKPGKVKYKGKTVTQHLAQASPMLTDLYEALKATLVGLGDDVQVKALKLYIAFRRIKNFASVEVHAGQDRLIVYVKVDPDTVRLEEGFTRDVRTIGHWGTGSLEITLNMMADLDRAKPLLERSYEVS